MVVFTCEACNESLKKNKVETHLVRCRRARHVTCIDCQVDFDRESFKAHTSCISEMEKYSGPGYVAKPSANKGARKQDDWFQRVQAAIDSCARQRDSQLSRVLLKVRESANVPRKQAKFINFCRNSMKWATQAVIERAWTLLAETASTSSKQPEEDAKPGPSAAGPGRVLGDQEAREIDKRRSEQAVKEASAAAEPSDKKKKKSKQLPERSELSATSQEASELAAEESVQKKKKSKTEAEAQELAAEESVQKKKKSKAEAEAEEAAGKDSEQLLLHASAEKKKKKRSKAGYASPPPFEQAEDVDAAAGGEANGDSPSERKKKKKRKLSENGIDAEEGAKELPERKKKKRQSSVNELQEANGSVALF